MEGTFSTGIRHYLCTAVLSSCVPSRCRFWGWGRSNGGLCVGISVPVWLCVPATSQVEATHSHITGAPQTWQTDSGSESSVPGHWSIEQRATLVFLLFLLDIMMEWGKRQKMQQKGGTATTVQQRRIIVTSSKILLWLATKFTSLLVTCWFHSVSQVSKTHMGGKTFVTPKTPTKVSPPLWVSYSCIQLYTTVWNSRPKLTWVPWLTGP